MYTYRHIDTHVASHSYMHIHTYIHMHTQADGCDGEQLLESTPAPCSHKSVWIVAVTFPGSAPGTGNVISLSSQICLDCCHYLFKAAPGIGSVILTPCPQMHAHVYTQVLVRMMRFLVMSRLSPICCLRRYIHTLTCW